MPNTPAWFDYNTYMDNKLAQLQATEPDADWTMDLLMTAFNNAGYVGEDGAYQHFVDYGASEDVSPNQFFDPDYYYQAKTVQYYSYLVYDRDTDTYSLQLPENFDFKVQEVKHLIEANGMNAWTHYVAHGSSEGVDPAANFDASEYCQAKANIMNGNGHLNNGVAWTAESMATAINAAGYTVLEHYLMFKSDSAVDEVNADATFWVANEFNPEVMYDDGTVADRYLTSGRDDIQGGDTALMIYALLDNGNPTLNSYDSIVGSSSNNDTLYLYSQDLTAGNIVGVENVTIAEAENGSTYNVSAFTSNVVVQAPAGNVTIEGLTAQNLSIENVSNAQTVTAKYGNDVLSTTINAEGSSVVTTLEVSGVETVTITGDSSLELDLTQASFDASASSAGMTVNASNASSNLFVGSEKGADKIVLTKVENLSESSGKYTVGNVAKLDLQSGDILDITSTTGAQFFGSLYDEGVIITDETLTIEDVIGQAAATVNNSIQNGDMFWFQWNDSTYLVDTTYGAKTAAAVVELVGNVSLTTNSDGNIVIG